jgi:hypothetical protein
MPAMIQTLLKTSAVWVVGLTLLNFSAHAVGTMLPPNASLDGFYEGCEGKARPCWHGIIPGVTTKEAARAILAQLGYSGVDSASGFQMDYHTTAPNMPQCIFIGYTAGGDEGKIASFELGCSNLTIGDITSTLGFPAMLRFDRLLSTLYVGYMRPDVESITKVTVRSQKLSAYTVADFIGFARAGQQAEGAAAWRGFAPIWRYCQIEPEYFGCKR